MCLNKFCDCEILDVTAIAIATNDLLFAYQGIKICSLKYSYFNMLNLYPLNEPPQPIAGVSFSIQHLL